MGSEVEDLFASFNLTDEDSRTYNIELNRFDQHYVGQKNVVYEQAKFDHRNQEEGESANDLSTPWRKPASMATYGMS